MIEKKNNLRSILKEGKTLLGPFCKLQDPAVAEIAGLAGFDFIIIDMEHGPHSLESVQNMIRAAELRNIIPVVRVTSNSSSLILRLLDIGVKCIQVPQVSTIDDAIKVVKATKFHPSGERGMCRYVRSADYTAIEGSKHFGNANNDITTIIHIEGLEGLDNLNEIVTVSGIDVIFLGPYDLSQSCDVPGQVLHEKVINRMKDAVTIARQNGKVVGTFTESIENAKMWKNIGVQYISYAVDVGIIMDSFKTIVKDFK